MRIEFGGAFHEGGRRMKKEEVTSLLRELLSTMEGEESATKKSPKKRIEKNFPSEGDTYYYLTSAGEVMAGKFEGSKTDRGRVAMGNTYETTEDVERAKKRAHSMAYRHFMPREGEKYHTISFSPVTREMIVVSNDWDGDPIDWRNFYSGRVFRDEFSAMLWITNFSSVWVGPEDADEEQEND